MNFMGCLSGADPEAGLPYRCFFVEGVEEGVKEVQIGEFPSNTRTYTYIYIYIYTELYIQYMLEYIY